MKVFRNITVVLFGCVIVCLLLFYNIGALLSASDAPGKADVIVCLSGSDGRIEKAFALLHQGLADRLVVTTDWVYGKMLAKKVPLEELVRAGSSTQTTYEEALAFSEYLQSHPADSAIIVTDPYHQYRVKWTFAHVFSKTKIKFTYVSTQPTAVLGFWWDDMNSRFFVLTEIPKVLYYWLYHGMLGFEDDPQWTVDLKKWYSRELRKVMAWRWVRAGWAGAA